MTVEQIQQLVGFRPLCRLRSARESLLAGRPAPSPGRIVHLSVTHPLTWSLFGFITCS